MVKKSGPATATAAGSDASKPSAAASSKRAAVKAMLQPFAKDWTPETASRVPPIWLMRQAGRYLPEYRATRAEAGGFLDLCYSPRLAAEVTLQPIRRYGFDAAILFSDILIVPDALGQPVRFVEGEGPRLDPITSPKGLSALSVAKAAAKFDIIAETVSRLSTDLPKETTLIGFCGAPWTVATYMVAGQGTSDQAPARRFAITDPKGFGEMIELLVTASEDYLARQVRAGAEILQIFDSWAGTLPDDQYAAWVIAPTRDLVQRLRKRGITVPIIGFARGNSALLARYLAETGVDALGCDTMTPLALMQDLGRHTVVQGNLDPLLLVAGGVALDARISEICAALQERRFVFNLGHGITPDTPPDHVGRLVERIRKGA
jgi:uroporphyrinogen decarboxylase